MLSSFLNDIREGDLIVPRRMAERLHLTVTGLSRLARLNRNTMIRRPESPAVQEKLGQIAHIITHAAQLAGGDARAIIWFRHQPLSGWNRTAEELVEEGLAREVLDDLDRHAEGVYS